jgi:hypothetical protein
VARRIVAARLATKRSRSADRVDDGSLHSSGAGTGAGQDARRGRGGAGGPSRSGAVWGAKDARRRGAAAPSWSGVVRGASDARRRGTAAVSALLGGGPSCCCSAGCPFAAPSALRVVGAESSISLAITIGAAPNKWSPSHIIILIGGRRARRADSPPFTHTGRETSGYTSIIDGAGLNQSNRVQRAAPARPAGALCTARTARAPVGGSRRYRAEAAEPVLYL